MQHTAGPLHSLERKLPLLIGSLVVVLVVAALVVTRYELRSSALEATDERLQRVGQQLAALSRAALDAREQVLIAAADDPVIGALLRGDTADIEGASAVLRRVVVRADSALPTELRDLHGQLAAAVGGPREGPARTDGGSIPSVPPSGDGVTYTPLHMEHGRGVYWVSVPVRDGSGVIGHIHQQRSIGSRTLGTQIEQLLGSDIDIIFANRSGDVWIGLDGDPAAGYSSIDQLDASHIRDNGAQKIYKFVTAVPGTPWLLVAQTPLELALARAGEGARRLLMIGVVLLLAGGLAAWLVSRSVTAPLRRLGAAADAIAAGDYTRRTGIERTDEIGFLASSFDQMVVHVESTHAELAARYGEARSLAAELESANTRLQQAVREIEAARTEAQQASRAKSEFLATMSHEIRTPINAMIGYADLLDLGVPGPMTEQQREFMVRIRRSGEHLISLVNDVLDFAKVESGQMRIAREDRSVAGVIDAAVSMMHGPATAKNVALRVSCPADAMFHGDVQRVQQILLNLLSNALKFSDAGAEVHVLCERRQSRAHPPLPDAGDEQVWTCITVADTGPGIEADQHARIFEPFVQGASGYTRPHGGTGLGLAISRSLARMMNGDLTVESAPGQGARFTVWLPHPSSPAVRAA
jgi:signal transduction histidine kinase